jgi:hypothetical protein
MGGNMAIVLLFLMFDRREPLIENNCRPK